MLLARYRFPGKRLLERASSTCRSRSRRSSSGLALVLVYGPQRLVRHRSLGVGIDVIYAMPGMVLATVFVSLPLVVREVVPVLEDEGIEQEQAAASLGANALAAVPADHAADDPWALAYGVVLSHRPLRRRVRRGEGGVRATSPGQTQTATLLVDNLHRDRPEPDGGYPVTFVLMLVAVLAIVDRLADPPPEEGPDDGHRGPAASASGSATSSRSTTST